jgi:hypothetical protein
MRIKEFRFCKKNLFLENLEEYLLFVNSSEEFMEKYDKVVQDCTLEFDGGLIHKYIYILVSLLFPDGI